MNNLKEVRKKQIIESAIEVFSKNGFYKGTVSQIADNAGLGKGTIYDYFSSKEEIFDEMLNYILEEYIVESKKVYKVQGSAKDKIVKLIDFNYEFLDINQSIIEQTFFRLENISTNIKPKVKKLHLTVLHFIVEIIKEGIENKEIKGDINIEATAFILMNIINKTHMKKLVIDDIITNEQLIEIIFDGIGMDNR